MTDVLYAPQVALVGSPWPGTGAGQGSVVDIDQELVCLDVVQVTHDVRTFVLGSQKPRSFGFRPGQYLTLGLDIGGQTVERCYTISSPPTRPDRVTITVKRVPGGPVSNWLHDHLSVGDRVRASGPFGAFTMLDHPAAKYLFLSAGSGVTPLMSMTRTLQDLPAPSDVVFVHSARTPDDIVFRDELDAMAVAGSGLRVAAICEADSPNERWLWPRGRLTLETLTAIAPDLLDREIFCCGPPPYMNAVRGFLDRAGVDPARRHEESFVLGDVTARRAPPAPDAVGGPPGTSFAVEFRRSQRVVVCEAGTSILEAASRAGLDLPSSCGEGVCGTCKSGLLEGRVDMQHAGGIRPREIAQGMILACCSTPLENLAIDA